MGTLSTGQAIKECRKNLGLTQKEVADYLGITSANISQIESGNRKNLKFDTIVKLCHVFSKKSGDIILPHDLIGHDMDYLLEQNNYDFFEFMDDIARESELNNELLKSLAQAFNKLNTDGRHIAVERVEELTEIKKYRKFENETSGKE